MLLDKLVKGYQNYLDNFGSDIGNLITELDYEEERKKILNIEERLSIFKIHFNAIERKWIQKVDEFFETTSVKHILLAEYPPHPEKYIYKSDEDAKYLIENRIILLDCVPFTMKFPNLPQNRLNPNKNQSAYAIMAMRAFDYVIIPKLEYIKSKMNNNMDGVQYFILYKRHHFAIGEFIARSYNEMDYCIPDVEIPTFEDFTTPDLRNKNKIIDRIRAYVNTL